MDALFTQSRNQLFLVHFARVGFFLVLLFAFFVFQALQSQFLGPELAIPWLGLLFFAFSLQFLLVWFFDRLFPRAWVTGAAFGFDVALMTALLWMTGLRQSLFFFGYLVTIILCGFVFGRRGSMWISLMSAISFVVLMIIGGEVRGQSALLLMVFNIFAFFVVGYLSGYLSEQLNFMGDDLARLKNINDVIVTNLAAGLMTLDGLGRVVQMNPAGQKVFVHTNENVDCDVETLWPGFWRRLQNHVTHQKGLTTRFEADLARADDENKVFSCVVTKVESRDTESGYVVLFEDITHVRRMELALRQSEKLAAVGALASSIAHEIRNPLASISGSIQLLQSSLQVKDEEHKKLMQISIKEIDRLNNLISEFMEFVKPEATPSTPINLIQILKEVMEMVRLNKNLRQDVAQILDFQWQGMIAGNADKLKQAFLNIVLNAYQAMEQQTANAQIRIQVRNDGNKVQVLIRDNGPGMEEKTLKRLFEPFHTTKPKGTGLGLAVTHKILQSHGAFVFVQSRRGEGTEFTIEFPLLPFESGADTINQGRAS
jgi:two-component system sensor histidine kinase PilS (NtrC family)